MSKIVGIVGLFGSILTIANFFRRMTMTELINFFNSDPFFALTILLDILIILWFFTSIIFNNANKLRKENEELKKQLELEKENVAKLAKIVLNDLREFVKDMKNNPLSFNFKSPRFIQFLSHLGIDDDKAIEIQKELIKKQNKDIENKINKMFK